MPISYWNDPDSTWDQLQLGPHNMPGTWQIHCRPRREIDLKKSAGKDGAHVKDKGYEPAKVQITGIIGTREDWNALQALLPDLHPRKKGGARNPLNIVHPATQFLGITQVYVVELGTPTIDKSTGVATFEIEAVEWFTDPKVVQKAPSWTDADGERLDSRSEVGWDHAFGWHPQYTPPSDDAAQSLTMEKLTTGN